MERKYNAIPDFVLELLATKAGGLLSTAQEDRLSQWLSANPEHVREAMELLNLLQKQHYVNLQKKVDKKQGWNTIQQKIHTKSSLRLNLWKYSKIAALIVVLIGFAWYLKFYILEPAKNEVIAESVNLETNNNKVVLILSDGNMFTLDNPGDTLLNESNGVNIRNKPGQMLSYDQQKESSDEKNFNKLLVPAGTRYQLQLSDGTKIWINALSSLEFPVVFSKSERRVTLTGEAFFEVEKDNERPFIVVANGSEIKVLGTSFNVSAYESDQRIETTLVEGSVEVNCPGKESIRLLPSQLLRINTLTNSTEIETVNTRYYTSWKDDILYFDNLSLQELAIRLERWYDVEIVFKNENTQRKHFSGAMENSRDIEFILNLISQTTYIKFEINGKKIFVE
jgi:transmembrane sensor